MNAEPGEELAVPLLARQEEEEAEEEQQQDLEITLGAAAAAEPEAAQQGDLEQGLIAAAGSEAGGSNRAEDEAAYEAARAVGLAGPGIYFGDLFRLCIFYWAIVSDALLLKELYAGQYIVLAGLATGFTVGPHVLMSLLLIIRQGWLMAASQAVGFILTLNPFENLTPIPQGIVGLFMLSIGFIAYVLIAASGLIFVAYCVVCYLVTALLFSLLILDLAALVITVAPSKAIFKYTDLVYTENFKTSRLVFQAWLQSAPELVVIGLILYRNMTPAGPAVIVPGPLLLQALVAHLINLWDKTLLFRSCAAQSGCSIPRQLLLLLGIRGSCRLSLPVLRENLSRVLRGAGGAGAGLGATLHLSSAEEVPDDDSDAAASMVPEYLTPNNGGLLSPGQLVGLSRAVFLQHGGPEVAELVLEITPDVMVGKLLSDAAPSLSNVSRLRLVNAGARGADAAALANALLQLRSLRVLQLHQVVLDERGAAALSRLLAATPTLQQLELCRCKLRRRAAVALAQGLRANRTLRQLNLAGVRGLDEAGAVALAGAVSCSKALTALNLAFVKLSEEAVGALIEVVQTSSSLRVVAVSQSSLPVAGARKLLATISGMTCPKAPPSLSCNLNLGTFPVEGLDSKVQFLVVQDQDSMTLDAWQGLAGPLDSDEGLAGATADPEGSRSPPGSARAAGRGGSGSEGEGGEVELEAAPLLLQLPPAAAVQPQQQQQPRPQPHSPAAAFGVVTPVGGVTPTGSPRAVAAAASSSSGFAGVSSLLPRATAAWVSGGSSGSPQRPSTPSSAHHAATTAAAASNGASSSKSAGGGRCPSYVCPCLVFVVEQQECTGCMVQTPLLFEELDTLNLSGLGIGDEGAAGMAKTLTQNPNMRRCVLSDNKIGAEGGAALAASLAINTNLQVLDLSSNEFSAEGVGVIADATRNAAGLRQLRLLGNKIPFGLDTLCQLMQAEAANPACHLVLVEDPAEVLDEIEGQGDAQQLARASEFYQRQEQYRQQRRSRILARQQRLAQLSEQTAQQQAESEQPPAAAAAGAAAPEDTSASQQPAAWIAESTSPAAGAGSSSGMGLTAEPSGSSIASIDGQPLKVVVHSSSGSSNDVGGERTDAAAAAAGSSGLAGRGSPGDSGSLSSMTADEDTCGICFDNNNHVAIKYCGHRLCVDCYRKVWELSGGDSTCPFCRSRLDGYMYLDSLDLLLQQ